MLGDQSVRNDIQETFPVLQLSFLGRLQLGQQALKAFGILPGKHRVETLHEKLSLSSCSRIIIIMF